MTARALPALLLLLTALGSAHVASATGFGQRPEVRRFIDDMQQRHGYSASALQGLFDTLPARPAVIEAMTRPAEAKPWHAYRRIFLTDQRIDEGVAFWRRHQPLFEAAEAEYGVDAGVIVAILGVETLYGTRTGSHPVLETLATLAFDYPKRADFFRRELEHYLLLTRDEGLDTLGLTGSYAGAMGMSQFISSSYRAYAVDFDGDGQRDLWGSPADAIGSIANYLARHGWRRGEPIATPARVSGSGYKALLGKDLKPRHDAAALRRAGVRLDGALDGGGRTALIEFEGDTGAEHWAGHTNFYAITRYNHSPLYALAVFQLREAIVGRRGRP